MKWREVYEGARVKHISGGRSGTIIEKYDIVEVIDIRFDDGTRQIRAKPTEFILLETNGKLLEHK